MSKRKANELIDYDSFLERFYHSNTQVETKLGAKKSSAMELHDTAARLSDVKSLLVDTFSAISDPNTSKTKANAAKNVFNKTILPSLDVVVESSRTIANVVSPISGGGYVHNRMMADARREAQDTSPLTRVNEYISKSQTSATKSKSKSPAKKSQPSRKAKAPKLPTTIDLPVPTNGKKEYGVGEFIQHAIKYPKGSPRRGEFIAKVMFKQLVKKDISTIHRKLRAYEVDGKMFAFDAKWNGVGRQPFLTKEEVIEAARRIMSNGGEKEMLDEVNKIFLEKERKCGGLPESSKRYSTKVLRNYFHYICVQAGVTITDLSVPKSPNRWIRERSFIGAMAYAITVALAHIYVVPVEDPNYRKRLAKIPRQDRLLLDMYSDVVGNKPIQCIPPQFIINADETTIFITQGVQPSNSRTVGIVSKSAVAGKDKLSICHSESSKKMNGMRIKRMLITNACGDVAVPVITIKVTRQEMPNHDILPVRIQGLCRGGGGLGGSTGWGVLLFVVKQEGADEKKNEWIHNNILVEFIKNIRTNYPTSDIAQDNTAKYWSDSDPPNVRYLTSPAGQRLLNDNDITAIKHGAARTAAEQANDGMRTFAMEKQENKRTTMEDVPSASFLLKHNIETTLINFEKDGTLKLKKRGVVVDFASKFPDMISKSCTRKVIIAGYHKNGQIDSTGMIPVFQTLLATCRRPPTPFELELAVKSFRHLLGWSLNNGCRYIPDKEYIAVGFTRDRNKDNEEVEVTAGIGQEHEQRTKILNAEAEVAKRAAAEEAAEQEKKR